MPRPGCDGRQRRTALACPALGAALALAWAAPSVAASQDGLIEDLGDATEKAGQTGKSLGLVAMPIPVSTPSVGTGMAVAALALYSPRQDGPPWTTGIGGLYTDTKSWGVGVFQRAALGDDQVRLTAFAGVGDFHLDFYGAGGAAGDRGVSAPIEQRGVAAFAQGLIRIRGDLYAGPAVRFIGVDTAIDLGALPFPDMALPEAELDSQTAMIGLAAEFDTRDAEYSPHSGVYVTAQYLSAGDFLGGDFRFDRMEFAANAYFGLSEDTVLAARVAACNAGEGAPFYQLCMYGQNNDVRGYASGRYRDRALAAGQIELRQHVFWRIGMVAFAGAGGVGEELGDIGRLLPAGGLGLRLMASEDYGLNLSIDYAVGRDSEALYFYIGEAF